MGTLGQYIEYREIIGGQYLASNGALLLLLGSPDHTGTFFSHCSALMRRSQNKNAQRVLLGYLVSSGAISGFRVQGLEWGFPKFRGNFLGAPSIVAFWDLFWDPPSDGTCHMGF